MYREGWILRDKYDIANYIVLVFRGNEEIVFEASDCDGVSLYKVS